MLPQPVAIETRVDPLWKMLIFQCLALFLNRAVNLFLHSEGSFQLPWAPELVFTGKILEVTYVVEIQSKGMIVPRA